MPRGNGGIGPPAGEFTEAREPGCGRVRSFGAAARGLASFYDVMTTTDSDSFHDPELKASVRRVWGAETAPATLRERIQAMGIGAASAPAAGITPAPAARRPAWTWPLRHPRPLYALAASVMMALGFAVAYQLDQAPAWKSTSGAYVISGPTGPATPPPTTAPSMLPPTLIDRLADAHVRCVHYPDHDGFKNLSRDDFSGVAQRLQNELGFSVLTGPVDDDKSPDPKGAWDFRGAAVCPVGQVAAAHLLFSRRGQAVSLFSLPRASCPNARTGDVFESEDPDHPVTVFVRPGGIHCVVGSSDDGSLSAAGVRRLGDRLVQK